MLRNGLKQATRLLKAKDSIDRGKLISNLEQAAQAPVETEGLSRANKAQAAAARAVLEDAHEETFQHMRALAARGFQGPGNTRAVTENIGRVGREVLANDRYEQAAAAMGVGEVREQLIDALQVLTDKPIHRISERELAELARVQLGVAQKLLKVGPVRSRVSRELREAFPALEAWVRSRNPERTLADYGLTLSPAQRKSLDAIAEETQSELIDTLQDLVRHFERGDVDVAAVYEAVLLDLRDALQAYQRYGDQIVGASP